MDVLKDIPVNDGGGFLDNIGLMDSLIVDCNNSTKALVSGNYVMYSSINVQMVQKLTNLKKAVKEEMDGLKKQIEDLKGVVNGADGSVHNTLDGAMGSGEGRVRDLITAEGGRLDADPDHTGT